MHNIGSGYTSFKNSTWVIKDDFFITNSKSIASKNAKVIGL